MRSLAGVILIVLGFLAACASPTLTPTPVPTAVPTAAVRIDPRTTRPCDILSAQEASAIFGSPVRESAMGNVPDLTKANFIVCGYTTPTAPVTGFSFTVFGLRIPGTGQTIFEQNKTDDSKLGLFTPVSGLGDEAYWNGNLLWVRMGDLTLGVTGAKEFGASDKDLAINIAQLVLDRLE